MTYPIDVYWNLRRNVYSVRARSGPFKGRVVRHVEQIDLKDATFVVNPGGRGRVRREGQKNVHAFIRGDWDVLTFDEGRPVTYNPYANDTLVMKDSGEPVIEAGGVRAFIENGRPVILI